MTKEEREQIIAEVMSQVEMRSHSVDELEEVSDMEGVSSLPAMKDGRCVSVPMSLIGGSMPALSDAELDEILADDGPTVFPPVGDFEE